MINNAANVLPLAYETVSALLQSPNLNTQNEIEPEAVHIFQDVFT